MPNALVYPDQVRLYVAEEKARGVEPRIIATNVRAKWPQYPSFSDASVRALTRTKTKRNKDDQKAIEAAQQAARRIEKVGKACPYITMETYPSCCGKAGDPYCAEHKLVVSGGQGGSKYHMVSASLSRSL